MKRNFLTAFDTVNNSRYLFFPSSYQLPLTPRYFVKYHTLSGGTFLSLCETIVTWQEKKEREGGREREIGTANRRVFYGSVGRLAKGLLSASDRWGLGSLILRSIKIDPSLPPWNSLSPFAKEERRRPISSFSPIPVTSRSNNTVPLGLSFLLNNL